MPRQARMIVEGEAAVYHVVSRTALNGFVLGDVEKDFLLKTLKWLAGVYFCEVLGFCIMGNHFHLVIKMLPGEGYDDKAIRRRFERYYEAEPKKVLMPGQIPTFRAKWASLSEFVKEIKQRFSRYYNKRHRRKGFFWSERFKSVIVENGETLINCLAYVDLNPVRAGLAEKPEQYRWCSLGYHVQANNQGRFLSLDFGLSTAARLSNSKRLALYRAFVYEKGSLDSGKGKIMNKELLAKESGRAFKLDKLDRFRYRTRYFVDSGIIGSKAFVERLAERLQEGPRRERPAKKIAGLSGVYSLKRLSEVA